MNISLFEVVGLIMVGPSSSHTAGAAKLSRIARNIANGEVRHVFFGLHGSFAKTYKGHATDKALVAGMLGLREDDERLSQSFIMAEEKGLSFEFYECEIEGAHENSVKITMELVNGKVWTVTGSSIGGGRIIIKNINGYATSIELNAPTIIIIQYDKKGTVSDISRILAEENLNIATMSLSRKTKGQMACCIIETDEYISEITQQKIMENGNVVDVIVINEGGGGSCV